MYGETPATRLVKSITVRHGILYPSKIPPWLCHASLDSPVNRPDSKARACPEARYKVYWIYHSFVTKHIEGQANVT